MSNWVVKFILLCAVLTANAADFDPKVAYLDAAANSLQILKFNADGLQSGASVGLSLAIVPIVSLESPFARVHFGADHQLPVTAVMLREATWTEIPVSGRQLRRGRISLLPLLRIERAGEQLELRPRLRSLSIEWRKTF